VVGKTVVIFDFAWDLAVMRGMLAEAKALVIIDHHVTSVCGHRYLGPLQPTACTSQMAGLAELPPTVAFFDMEKPGFWCVVILLLGSRCAARLAWEFFFPDLPLPTFVSPTCTPAARQTQVFYSCSTLKIGISGSGVFRSQRPSAPSSTRVR
jgi:hypothetical protein